MPSVRIEKNIALGLECTEHGRRDTDLPFGSLYNIHIFNSLCNVCCLHVNVMYPSSWLGDVVCIQKVTVHLPVTKDTKYLLATKHVLVRREGVWITLEYYARRFYSNLKSGGQPITCYRCQTCDKKNTGIITPIDAQHKRETVLELRLTWFQWRMNIIHMSVPHLSFPQWDSAYHLVHKLNQRIQ